MGSVAQVRKKSACDHAVLRSFVFSSLAAGEAAASMEEDTMHRACFYTATTLVAGLLAVTAGAQQAPERHGCKAIHADLVEMLSTTGCKPGHASCFLGEVDGNHGLRGTTYFKGEASALFPSGAPTFRSYVGDFEYITGRGTLTMREMGLSEPSGNTTPQGGPVNAFQRIVGGTDDFEGATGHLFVSGFNRSGHVVTTVHGEICTH
jgi:hypothetical protein